MFCIVFRNLKSCFWGLCYVHGCNGERFCFAFILNQAKFVLTGTIMYDWSKPWKFICVKHIFLRRHKTSIINLCLSYLFPVCVLSKCLKNTLWKSDYLFQCEYLPLCVSLFHLPPHHFKCHEEARPASALDMKLSVGKRALRGWLLSEACWVVDGLVRTAHNISSRYPALLILSQWDRKSSKQRGGEVGRVCVSLKVQWGTQDCSTVTFRELLGRKVHMWGGGVGLCNCVSA